MNEKLQNTVAQTIEPWPVGWPLPLTAVAHSLRWEDVVEVYLAYCEQVWGPAAPGQPAQSTLPQAA